MSDTKPSTDEKEKPPSSTPPSRPGTPGIFSYSNSSGMGFFSVPFERFIRDEASEWTGAFTLLGMFSFIVTTIARCFAHGLSNEPMNLYALQTRLRRSSMRGWICLSGG